jgi:NADH-quinone oxidoreductase subunit L
MQHYIWLVPLLPLLGFVINGALALLGAAHLGPADPSLPHELLHELPHEPNDDQPHLPAARPRFANLVTIVGPLVIILSFVLGVAIFVEWVQSGQTQPFVQTYFAWLPVGDLQINAALQVDQLSILMVLVITGVGSLIHI